MTHTTLIILTRNEISGLKALLKKIPLDTVDEYFAVDYKSTDGSVEFFQDHGIQVIQQKNPGRAEAFRIGVAHAKGKYLIFFSPDGNENPEQIPKLIKKLDDGFDLVIASRFLKGSRNEEDDDFFKFRKWANQGFTFFVNGFWGGMPWRKKPYITDTINGYRAIRKDAYTTLALDAKGYAIEYQMTIRALKKDLRICEIPTTEGNRIGGKSGSSAIPTGLQFLYYSARELLQ